MTPTVAFGLLAALVLLLCLHNAKGENKLARGFNDDIDWVEFDEGHRIAKKENKPIMLLIHKSWCGACKALKPQVATSKEMEDQSKHFVMINVEDDEEPVGAEYSPDGGYIPRVLFLNPKGEVVKDLYNENGSANYKYYYPLAKDLEMGMVRARSHFDNSKTNPGDEL